MTINYLRSHPKTVIGGSGASYTQIEGARPPKDIDLIVKGKAMDSLKGVKTYVKQKYTSFRSKSLKEWFKGSSSDKEPNLYEIKDRPEVLRAKASVKGSDAVDIHGREMYKAGSEHRFGFRSKTPVKIGEHKYFRAGEQLFRKGVASVVKERSYRWGKDRPDFITHAESLIKSTEGSWNPVTRWRGRSAARHLELFKDPSQSSSAGVKGSWLNDKVSSFAKRYYRSPEIAESIYGDIDFIYPKGTFTSHYAGYPTAQTGGYTSSGSIGKPPQMESYPTQYNYDLYPKVDRISGYAGGYTRDSLFDVSKISYAGGYEHVRSSLFSGYQYPSTASTIDLDMLYPKQDQYRSQSVSDVTTSRSMYRSSSSMSLPVAAGYTFTSASQRYSSPVPSSDRMDIIPDGSQETLH